MQQYTRSSGHFVNTRSKLLTSPVSSLSRNEEGNFVGLQNIKPMPPSIVGGSTSFANMKRSCCPGCCTHPKLSDYQSCAKQGIDCSVPYRISCGQKNINRCAFVEHLGRVHWNQCTDKWTSGDTSVVDDRGVFKPCNALHQQQCFHKPVNNVPSRAEMWSMPGRTVAGTFPLTSLSEPTTTTDIKCTAELSTAAGAISFKNTPMYIKKPPQQCAKTDFLRTRKTKSYVRDKAPKIRCDEMTQERIKLRRSNVCYKMMHQDPVNLTKYEQYDVHQRADEYVTTVIPHPDYIIASPDRQHEIKEWVENYPSNLNRKKRRRRVTCLEDTEFFSHERPEYDNYITLDNGVTLLRPPNKLVGLVAEAVNESPDGLLQVQQVYHIIMARYPYFRYLSKDYLISWRSSIRHALYQKWFTKIEFNCEFIKSRGCYWSLNRKVTPKEWKLPPRKYFDIDVAIGTQIDALNSTKESANFKKQDPVYSITGAELGQRKRKKPTNRENNSEHSFWRSAASTGLMDPMLSVPASNISDKSSEGSQGADSGYYGYQFNFENEVSHAQQPLDLTAPSKAFPLTTTGLMEFDVAVLGTAISPVTSTDLNSPLIDLKDVEWEDPDIDTTVEYEELKEAEQASLSLLKAMGEQMGWENCGDYNNVIQWDKTLELTEVLVDQHSWKDNKTTS